ncbi:MAG: hypothetical protein KBT20_10295 [Bacteroidales bacterium]|nr:hypothetical protein [Candidatus Liminaster caballi]
MRKVLLLVIAFMASALSFAEDTVASMVVTKTDGSECALALSNVRSIKFDEGKMKINLAEGCETIAVDEISIITFGDMPSAIAAIAGKDGSQMLTVLDMAGNVVFNGCVSSWSSENKLHGIYVINGRKVMIK